MDALEQAAILLTTIDLATFLLWAIEGVVMIARCRSLLLSHVVVGVHFGVQTAALLLIIDDYRNGVADVDEPGSSGRRRLPHRFPLILIFGSLFALFGDIFMLAFDSDNYAGGIDPSSTTCRDVLVFELFIEALVTLSALLSVVYFLALVIERGVYRRQASQREEAQKLK